MKKSLLFATLLLAGCSGVALDHHPHWGYEGEQSPEHWGQIAPEFALCGAGQNQSPVNIQGALKAQQTPLKLSFQPGQQEIVNNGHTIQVNAHGQNTLVLDADTFVLQQFHFHAPSENQIDGKSFPLEAHFVYQNNEGALAVLALMFNQGNASRPLQQAWQHMPTQVNQPGLLSTPINIEILLPDQLDFYRFSGSLTTPPCSDGVRWLVLKQPVSASAEQIQQFRTVMQHANNRPVQPLNGRVIIH